MPIVTEYSVGEGDNFGDAMTSLTDALERIRSGDNLDFDQALELATGNEPTELL